MISLSLPKTTFQPLDIVELAVKQPGTVSVRDAKGRAYFEQSVRSSVSFRAAGALGGQIAFLLDEDGRMLDSVAFAVKCQTSINERSGKYQMLFQLLHDTLQKDWTNDCLRIGDKFYWYYVSWLRDHVHTLKGMKYFDDEVKTGIELYADTQREDGMIWDKVKEMFHSEATQWRDFIFKKGDFVRPIPGPGNERRRFQRIPVENDVEYLFIEGLYYAWKACGDDRWMAHQLDHAIRAVEYSTSDPYRWSSKFKLLKRGYTIDTWDFQSADDVAVTGEGMVVDPDKTTFGIMHGDNTGMYASCLYLGEMLRVAGRNREADSIEALASELKERLDKIAWTGDYYRHHVSEDPSFERDLGSTDEEAQVSLSNAYALNRRLPHDQCAAIIRKYQAIREEMPATSPGEFYSIYPPFEKGFGHSKWNYVNGGVITIVAGELAHGAFEHGFEDYGADILARVVGLAEQHGGYLHTAFRGCMPEVPKTEFRKLDLSGIANVDFHGNGAAGVPGWTGEKENDLRNMPTGQREFHGIPFTVIDPSENGRRACIGLSSKAPYLKRTRIEVNAKAKSLYLLHAVSKAGTPAGLMRFDYADGTKATVYMIPDTNVGNWFSPPPAKVTGGGNKGKKNDTLRVAWSGENPFFPNVGVWIAGFRNPHPEKKIVALELEAAENDALWFVLGATLSDQPVALPLTNISYGIPDMWGAAAVLYALIEGMAGVVDAGTAFSRLSLAPRWRAGGVKDAVVSVVYPASGGYAVYRFMESQDGSSLDLMFATSAEETDLRILLPKGRGASAILVDGESAVFTEDTIEGSCYAIIPIFGCQAHSVKVSFV